MSDENFTRLLSTCHELSALFPDIVYIGGIAIYLHAINRPETKELGETTHDADFYISLADMADLRDVEEVTSNRRLSKSQIIKNRCEFDIYTERQSALIVPYQEVAADAVAYGDMRVASLEHLLVLKTEAACDRAGSAKGEKDARDLISIACLSTHLGFDFSIGAAFLSDRHVDRLNEIAKGGAPVSVARGNAQAAKALRTTLRTFVSKLTSDDESGGKQKEQELNAPGDG